MLGRLPLFPSRDLGKVRLLTTPERQLPFLEFPKTVAQSSDSVSTAVGVDLISSSQEAG